MVSYMLIGVVLASLCSVVRCEFCYNGDQLKYCDYGCCGSNNYSCCPNIGAIVLGTIVGLLALVTVLVTIFCCCRKSRGSPGMTFRTNNGGMTTTTTTTVGGPQVMVNNTGAPASYPAYGQPQPMGAYPAQPMGAYPAQPMGAYPATQPMKAYPAASAPDEKWQQEPPAYNTVN